MKALDFARELVVKYGKQSKYGKYTRYAGAVGYAAFYAVSLPIFARLTFPYEKLKEHLVASFNAAQIASGGLEELQIDEMGGHWLTGFRMKGVRLLSSGEPGKPPAKTELDEATARFGMFAAMLGDTDVSFDVDAFGGQVSGSYEANGKETSIDVTLDSIDLSKVDRLGDLLDGVPVRGRLGGTVRLKMPEGKASKGNGALSLEAHEVTVGDDKAKIKGALALPRINAGTLTFVADAKDGIIKINKLAGTGKDIEVQGDGRITMRELATESICDVGIRFRVTDAYRGKSDITKSLFGAPGSTAPGLFELADPKVKQAKRADGFYSWAARGALGRLEFVPKP